ncbi:MAG: VWA domain-containing protein, partial [Blautia sp.]|nr:VWA domain-containing protein [Blautia sp.]
QVYIRMPTVMSYYRPSEGTESPSAWLGGEKLKLTDDQVFSETGESVEYYVLLDISASIPDARFNDIKDSLYNFYEKLRDKDRLILITFGNEVTTVLKGKEDKDTVFSSIAALQNHDQNTLLFDAIDKAADKITSAADKKQKRRILMVISDGKDCADNTKTMDSVEKRLISKGIPVYTLAVENDEGDSAALMQDYRSKFSSMAADTGGIPWTIDQGTGVEEGLSAARKAVLTSRRGTFRAASNKVSNKNEDFVMHFPDGTTQTVSILVSRSKPDEKAPRVEGISVGEYNELQIRYSEPVEHAMETGSYRMRVDGKTVAVQQVMKSKEEADTVLLVFAENLSNGHYELEISNVTDCSNEANPLENPVNAFSITGAVEPTLTPEEEEGTPLPVWVPWAAIAGAVVLLTLLFLLLRKKRRGKNGLDDQEIEVGGDAPGGRIHINPINDDENSRELSFWVRYGDGEPEAFTCRMQGSLFIGRNKETCNICCDDKTIGRQHFTISEEEDGMYVTDLDSTNGTFVNGQRVLGRVQIHDGDEVQAGNMFFRIGWDQLSEIMQGR